MDKHNSDWFAKYVWKKKPNMTFSLRDKSARDRSVYASVLAFKHTLRAKYPGGGESYKDRKAMRCLKW